MTRLQGCREGVATTAIGITAILVALLALTGCQSQRTLDRVTPLPNLNGPIVRQQTKLKATPAQAPVQTAAQTPAPVMRRLPAATIVSGMPAGWVPPVASRPWRYIVIHHSATPRGGAHSFDQEHRRRGWDGLGYDFVIGNGTDTRDGQIEVGPRWTRQVQGAHAGVALYNEYGIGICLVGDFNIDRPTRAQINSTARLVAYLMATYHIPASSVLGHRDIKPTDCPGRYVSVTGIRRLANQRIASGLARK